jgi:prepilin-type N-terminal cleavage/methylation domain-containing protein/prepilin-type processing-associated H-X9-DG protein
VEHIQSGNLGKEILLNRRAFTLIELLVVIAIIAILAAILFPVFAQAKQAAKKSASISNAKQQSLANIMYSGDADDVFVPVVVWQNSGAPAFVGGTGFQPWTWLILPYTKNADILSDPQAPPIKPWPSTWKDTTVKSLAPTYGYNYTYLSPFFYNNGWSERPISQTALGAPAETVMLTAKFSTSEHSLGATGLYWYGPGSFSSTVIVDTPDCYSIAQYCFDNWGTGGFWDDTYLLKNEAAGSRTGGMSLRGGQQAVVAWADGHVAAKSAGAMAAGTTWNRNSTTADVVINDVTKYLWDDK